MTPRSRKQNQRIQEQTRQQILVVALRAFGEKGYASTSVSYIASEAGISKGLIYHYFDSKEEVLKGIFGMMLKEGENIMAQWEGKTAAEKLRITIRQSVEFIKNQANTMRFMLSLALQPAVIQNLEQLIEAEKEKSMKQYEAVFRELGYDQPRVEAYYTGAVLDGAAFGFISVKDYPLDELEDKLLKHYQL